MSSFFDHNVVFALERAQRAVRRRVESELGAGGSRATVPQSMLLAFIEENPDLSQKDAAAFLRTDVMNVSRMTRELAARDLVRRERDPDDLRAFRVRLTDLGRAELADSRRQWTRHRRELAALLGQEDRDQLLTLLDRVVSWSEGSAPPPSRDGVVEAPTAADAGHRASPGAAAGARGRAASTVTP